MHCIKHNDQVAVASCGTCGVGMCSSCVENAIIVENKPTCDKCLMTSMDEYILSLKDELNKLKKRKIIWSVILALGLLSFISFISEANTQGDVLASVIICCFIWGFAGFWDRAIKKYELESYMTHKQAVSQAYQEQRMYKDGSIWVLWGFKLAWFIIRGTFFPIFYLKLMLLGDKEIKDNLQNAEDTKIKLQEKMQA